MPTLLDVVLVLACIAWGAWDHFHEFPRFLRALAAGRAGERGRFYGRIALGEWLLTAAVLVAWQQQHRAPALLGLGLPVGWRAPVAAVVVLLLAALVVVQARSVLALAPARLARVRARWSPAITGLLPHDAGEWRGFALLSLTAGLCEELLARGYLIWFFGAWLGPVGGLLASSVLFGLGHAYQGRAGVLKTAIVGLVLGALYLVTGSLLPGMIAHALMDLGSGFVSYRVLREPPPAPPA